MKRTALIAALTGVLLVLSLMVALAQDNPETDVSMGGYQWITIRCNAGGFTAQQRAAAVQRRVNDLLHQPGIDLDTVQVRQFGNDALIYTGDSLLITVSPCDARVNRTTPLGLARVWADLFKDLYPRALPRVPAVMPSGEPQ